MSADSGFLNTAELNSTYLAHQPAHPHTGFLHSLTAVQALATELLLLVFIGHRSLLAQPAALSFWSPASEQQNTTYQQMLSCPLACVHVCVRMCVGGEKKTTLASRTQLSWCPANTPVLAVRDYEGYSFWTQWATNRLFSAVLVWIVFMSVGF